MLARKHLVIGWAWMGVAVLTAFWGGAALSASGDVDFVVRRGRQVVPRGPRVGADLNSDGRTDIVIGPNLSPWDISVVLMVCFRWSCKIFGERPESSPSSSVIK